MKIPDEYWTTEVPTEAGHYAYRRKDATWVIGACSIQHVELRDGKVFHSYENNAYRLPPVEASDSVQWCRLAPAAELDRLKAENEKLRGLVYDAYAEAEQDARAGSGGWAASVTKSEMDRLEGRGE